MVVTVPRATPRTDTAAKLGQLELATAAIHRGERLLAGAREHRRQLITELHGTVPVERIAAAAGMTREHVHRLVRHQQKEV